MSFYNERVLPHLINWACGIGPVSKQRSLVVPGAYGDVLEVGFGSGLNLDHYNPEQVSKIWALEPSEGMQRKSAPLIAASPMNIEWLGLEGESVPLPDSSIDTVLLTYTLCTIPGFDEALSEMRRVLKPSGQLIFCEHGLAVDKKIQSIQNRLNPVWKRLAGGCHLNRDIPALIREAGFAISSLDEGYIKGPKFAAYTYWGKASART